VYRFDNEQLLEVVNRTAHAAALSALVDPFRRLIVHPSLLRSVRTTWTRTFGTA
jgi:hypothetical protein